MNSGLMVDGMRKDKAGLLSGVSRDKASALRLER